jgi:hypothetical protein
MNFENQAFLRNYQTIEKTGFRDSENLTIRPYQFGDYLINIILTEKGEFVGIKDISEKHRDFLTLKQKIGFKSSNLAEDLYRD